jgi:hypothetical protein
MIGVRRRVCESDLEVSPYLSAAKTHEERRVLLNLIQKLRAIQKLRLELNANTPKLHHEAWTTDSRHSNIDRENPIPSNINIRNHEPSAKKYSTNTAGVQPIQHAYPYSLHSHVSKNEQRNISWEHRRHYVNLIVNEYRKLPLSLKTKFLQYIRKSSRKGSIPSEVTDKFSSVGKGTDFQHFHENFPQLDKNVLLSNRLVDPGRQNRPKRPKVLNNVKNESEKVGNRTTITEKVDGMEINELMNQELVTLNTSSPAPALIVYSPGTTLPSRITEPSEVTSQLKTVMENKSPSSQLLIATPVACTNESCVINKMNKDVGNVHGNVIIIT